MKTRKIIWPRPKTGDQLRNALAGYGELSLVSPCDVFVCREEGKPCKLEIRHATIKKPKPKPTPLPGNGRSMPYGS